MHEHNEDVDLNLLEEMGYEHRDIDIKKISASIKWFFLVATIFMFVGMGFLKLAAPPDMVGNAPPKFSERKTAMPENTPMIQGNSTAMPDMRALVKQQRQAVSTYSWADRKSGHVQIPVAEAMKKVASRGLPTRLNPMAPEAAQ